MRRSPRDRTDIGIFCKLIHRRSILYPPSS
jgi:hypothetical protein